MSRPVWQGAISFGLVNIPIQLQTAIQEKSVSFHLLSKDGSCRLRRKLYCPDTGKEVDFGDTARGVEVAKDEYVLVDDKEIERMRPEKGKSIAIEQFVKLDEIDPIYFDRAYFVAPTNGSDKAYKLLHEAMKESGRVGVAIFVMRGRQYMCALRVTGDGLILHTMHYPDEVLSIDDALPNTLAKAKGPAKELSVARQLIDAMTHKLDLSGFHDDYREQVTALIERKRSGKKTVAPADDHDDAPAPKTSNLMDALRRSLSVSKSPRAHPVRRPRVTARRRRTAA
jgi:DNA end-binding protein Ku